jgi:hypothetical protein
MTVRHCEGGVCTYVLALLHNTIIVWLTGITDMRAYDILYTYLKVSCPERKTSHYPGNKLNLPCPGGRR